jgi:periplasmic protein TonB
MRFRRADTMSRPGVAAGLAGTLVVHAGLIALGIVAVTQKSVWQPTVYAVELVAAPKPAATATPVTPSPPAAPAPPVVNPKSKPPAKSAPVEKPKPPAKVDPKVEPTPARPSTATPAPGATPSTGTDVDNVRVAGEAFPFPDYLRNIMNQILRRWARPRGTALTAEVSFTIARDGSVGDIRVIRSSRSYSFDLEAQGAIEQAGTDKAFGPLPGGWNSDILKVAFLFTPRPQ